MKFSLRSLLLTALVGPPVLAGVFFWLREAGAAQVILAAGFTLFLLIAAYDYMRGY